ncbi:MAG TPA: hypothetical protein VGS41_18800, partial [Chthonomonadales bacterium]|nr:hypothetical protein [Chthonomonadales bacterium]
MTLRYIKPVLFLAAATITSPCMARPAYAIKEGKPCRYCHLNPAGGGARNGNGVYYQAHHLSFAGFDEKKQSLPPAFVSVWTLQVPPDTSRAAAAALATDSSVRLALLGAGSTLQIYKVSGDTLDKQMDLDLGADAARFEVGRFA